MYKLFSLLILFFLSITCRSQTGVYKTYIDYQNRSILPMDSILDFEMSISGTKIFFLNTQKKKETYKTKQMWGFVYKGHLFRCFDSDFSEVIDTGRICYYESGIAHLRSINTHDRFGYFRYGNVMYLSKDLNSKYYDSYKKFCKEYPEVQDFEECLKISKPKMIANSNNEEDFTQYIKDMRKCVASFNSHK